MNRIRACATSLQLTTLQLRRFSIFSKSTRLDSERLIMERNLTLENFHEHKLPEKSNLVEIEQLLREQKLKRLLGLLEAEKRFGIKEAADLTPLDLEILGNHYRTRREETIAFGAYLAFMGGIIIYALHN